MIDKIDSVIIDSYFVVQMTQMYAVCSSSLVKIKWLTSYSPGFLSVTAGYYYYFLTFFLLI